MSFKNSTDGGEEVPSALVNVFLALDGETSDKNIMGLKKYLFLWLLGLGYKILMQIN